MDENGIDDVVEATPKRRRRSKLERLQDEKEQLEKRLAITKQKREEIEGQLKQAEAREKLILKKSHLRDALLIGVAFLGLLEQDDLDARVLKMALLKNADKAERSRMWEAFQRHSPASRPADR